MPRHLSALLIAFLLIESGWSVSAALAQDAPKKSTPSSADNSRAAERRKVLESERWRSADRAFDEWLSVQTAYDPEELAAVKKEMGERVAKMTPQELQQFIEDMEDRLQVLLSPEAKDARLWLEQFRAVARNPEHQLGRSRPDVLNMTASQIRQEIQWLDQHRAGRQQAQAAFSGARALQNQAARNVQTARQTTREPANRSNWPANTPRARSSYSPRRELQPEPLRPIYTIGPWGAPVAWHPLSSAW